MNFSTMNKINTPMQNKTIFRALLLSAACICSFSLQAQDKKAKALLDQVSAKVKSYSTIIIDFKYSLSNAKENINQDSKGNVVLKGNQYVLNFMGATKLYDGKKTYTIVPEDEEITISKVDENDNTAVTPNKMLTFFNTGYKYTLNGDATVKGKKIQYVKLVPMSSKDQRKEIILGIDSQTKNIYNLVEVGKKGTKTTLTVNSFKTNQPLPKNQFTFVKSKYPNYYINSLD
jgi:outer membrane lipoprotein-sorting protein